MSDALFRDANLPFAPSVRRAALNSTNRHSGTIDPEMRAKSNFGRTKPKRLVFSKQFGWRRLDRLKERGIGQGLGRLR
ncbi:MAG: hypothetical protein WB689_32845 [Xanthobacteraceae bacterium]